MQLNQIDNWIVSVNYLFNEINSLNKISRKFRDIAKRYNNKNIESELFRFIKVIYTSDIVMRIRRLIDEDKRTVSLFNLINEILFEYAIIDKKWFLNKYSDGKEEKMFKSLFKDNIINTNLLIDDLNFLKKESVKIKIYADKIIAHKDKNIPKNLLTFNEVEFLIKIITDMFDKYYYLLKQSHSNIGK